MIFNNEAKEYIGVYELDRLNIELVFQVSDTDMTFIWNTGEKMDIVIDNIPYSLAKNTIVFLTEFHHIESIDLKTARMVRFNQSFYCIVNHDNEVGSKGTSEYHS